MELVYLQPYRAPDRGEFECIGQNIDKNLVKSQCVAE